jgi:predicted nucleic acid-binding Zn ribbon protein
MALTTCPECKKEISSEASACPNCGYSFEKAKKKKKSNPIAVGCLGVIILFIVLYFIGISTKGTSTPSSSSSSSSSSTTSNEPLLELRNWSWHSEYDYAIAEGAVKNISNAKLENVEASVSFLAKDGSLITSSDAILEYNPILPGQTSPFKTMATLNPAMRSAHIEFKYLMGGTIPYKEKEKATKK